jgi:hypothetical protein
MIKAMEKPTAGTNNVDKEKVNPQQNKQFGIANMARTDTSTSIQVQSQHIEK